MTSMLELLKATHDLAASDLHLATGLQPMVRVDGDLKTIPNTNVLDAATTQTLLYSIMTGAQQHELEETRELDFGFNAEGIARFRANAFYQLHGLSAVFRTISATVPTLESLELPPIFRSLVNLSNGLILISGPTGSGKSTTLAAMIDFINTHQACHIITIEDPIEYVYTCKQSIINQREVHRDTRDFNAALRSALREDPDVILVGEMRDLETIRLALTAAETGHLVLATLHTSSAPRAISRIIDVFPSGEKGIIRNMLSESLRAVICQTLVKKVPGGRIPALEIMLGTSAIRNLIREDKVAQMVSVIQTGAEQGMCTLDQCLQNLLDNGDITRETAYATAEHKEAFI